MLRQSDNNFLNYSTDPVKFIHSAIWSPSYLVQSEFLNFITGSKPIQSMTSSIQQTLDNSNSDDSNSDNSNLAMI